MSASNPIEWTDLRAEFGFTQAEEAEMAAERSRLLAEITGRAVSRRPAPGS